MSTTENVMNIKGPQIDVNPGSTQAGRVASDAETSVAKKADGAQGAAPGDTVTLTEAVTEMANLEQALAGVPEVDSARVEQLQAAIKEGSYQVDPEQIVERLLGLDSNSG